MYKTTQQQKAIAEREGERRIRKPNKKKQTKKKGFYKDKKEAAKKKVDSTNVFLFLAKATEHEIPQTSTGFTKTADRGR